MLTVRYDQLGVQPGDRVLDLGCGFGRHAYESMRRGARVVACDFSLAELKDVSGMFAAIADEERGVASASEQPHVGELRAPASADNVRATLPAPAWGGCVNGDGTKLPFADDSFDRIIASEVLEHIPDDGTAIAELARVLRPGGTIAITVPAWLSERICWALNDEYHAPFVEGGHVRIYTEPELRSKLRASGLRPGGAHHAHALHAPYWWLKCAVGVKNDANPLVKAYHQVLLWDIGQAQPMGTVTRWLDRLGNPLIGKSLVVYATKPEETRPR